MPRKSGPFLNLLIALALMSFAAVRAFAATDPDAAKHEDAGPVAPTVEWHGEPSGSSVATKFALAVLYVGILGTGAFFLMRRKGISILPAAFSGGPENTIVVKQRLRVSPQLTVVVLDVDGKRFMLAVSPNAISTTRLD
ncbi:MAG: hypothetical protein ACREFM_18540 [Hypericibacter sp.]